MSKASIYLQAMRDAILANVHAHELFFPADRAERKAGTLRLGREFGAGLVGLDVKDVQDVIGSSYSVLVVANCFDRTGVQVNMKEWVKAIEAGMRRVEELQEEYRLEEAQDE